MAKRSSAHIKAQKEGRKRDLQICQICGSSEKPNGHHVIDVQFGGSSNAKNIVTLCDKHHKKVHANKIDITVF